MLYTTFALAKKEGACQESYRKFAKHVGGINKFGKDTPIPLTDVLEVLGLEDALWCLNCCTDRESALIISQILACDYAEHTLYIFEKRYPNDSRPRTAIETARRYIKGEATEQDWDAAGAACDAVGAAVGAAGAAAGDAEREWQTERFIELNKLGKRPIDENGRYIKGGYHVYQGA